VKSASVFLSIALSGTLLTAQAFATQAATRPAADLAPNMMDELDPYDPNINNILKEMDQNYEQETGTLPFLQERPQFFSLPCSRQNCDVYINIVKSKMPQKAYVYVEGRLAYEWLTSTGVQGRGTPNFDQHPDEPLRIYDKYTSGKFPGGDYNGLGNMPYAVFIRGGFAIHGTARSNWGRLGSPASHGCIRLHPDNGKIFNRLVRQYGRSRTWVTVN